MSDNLEEQFNKDFMNSASGDESMLKVASEYALQLDAQQIRTLLWLKLFGAKLAKILPDEGAWLIQYADNWVSMKKYNMTAPFIFNLARAHSLREFITENAFKVNIDK